MTSKLSCSWLKHRLIMQLVANVSQKSVAFIFMVGVTGEGSRFLRNIGNHLHGSTVPIAGECLALQILRFQISGRRLTVLLFSAQQLGFVTVNSRMSHFSSKDGNWMFLRNVGIYLRTNTASKPNLSLSSANLCVRFSEKKTGLWLRS
jgi:hypothetical protein